METQKSETVEIKRSKRKILLIGGAVLALIIIIFLIVGTGAKADAAADQPTATVSRGEMIVSLMESGEIRASEMTNISNDLRWETVILERVDEGQYVNKGDLIIRFECKDLLDAIDRDELDLTSADNDHIQALEKIELTRKELANQIAQAEGKLENSRNELEKFIKHERLQELQTAQSKLLVAQQDLELAENELNFKLAVNATEGLEGSYSQNSIEEDRLRLANKQLSVSNAEAEVEKLKMYEHPNRQRQLELSLEAAQLDLEKAKIESKAKQRQVEVDEKAKLRRLEKIKSQLAEKLEQKSLLEIRATSPGVIIYDSGNRWDPPDLSIGATVRPRKRLMNIPNMDTLKVFSRVYEGVSEQVKVGTPAIIRLDSRDALVIDGKVDKVSPVASSENHWLNPNQKVFPIEIEMIGPPDDLKPGSSAQVELILDKASDVLKVNIASVFTELESTYVWKLVDGQAVRTPIKIGRSNATEVEILDGLVEGDVVLLSPPPDKLLPETKEDDQLENPLDVMSESVNE